MSVTAPTSQSAMRPYVACEFGQSKAHGPVWHAGSSASHSATAAWMLLFVMGVVAAGCSARLLSVASCASLGSIDVARLLASSGAAASASALQPRPASAAAGSAAAQVRAARPHREQRQQGIAPVLQKNPLAEFCAHR